MCSDLRFPRDQRRGILSLILSIPLLTETVPIRDLHLILPHLETKTWDNMQGLEHPMLPEAAAHYRGKAKR